MCELGIDLLEAATGLLSENESVARAMSEAILETALDLRLELAGVSENQTEILNLDSESQTHNVNDVMKSNKTAGTDAIPTYNFRDLLDEMIVADALSREFSVEKVV